MLQPGFRNPMSATIRGLIDARRRRGTPVVLDDADRLDGKTCLITGANSGLGNAVAIALARRGARVLMACRSGIPDAGAAVRAASGSDAVEMLHVDLVDVASIHALCAALAGRGEALDVVVCNAAVMPRRARRTPSGFELMFAVNYLANVVLVHRLLGADLLRSKDGAWPRLVIVSSESHRGAKELDFDSVGDYVDYGMHNGMQQYAHTKLLLCTFAAELARRLSGRVGVHALCPGPVASNLAREAPAWVKPVLDPIMKWMFASPEVAAEPVVYLACASALADRTGVYLHKMAEVAPAEAALDPDSGARLWALNQILLDRAEATRSS
jgi:NAD(P)-dependent dehydrogenase (short-subunit alcohol dehydrogenase family)